MVINTQTGECWDISLRAFINRHRSRYNPHVLGAKVEVAQRADGGANVRIEIGDEAYTVSYGSYEVAKGYFGEPKGWRGSKMLAWATRTFYFADGSVDESA